MGRILLIDDDEDYASVVQMRLRKEGFDVEWSANPLEAITRLEKDFHFDLIILDVEMPERNGLSTLVHLKNHFNTRRPTGFDIPVLIATGVQSERLQAIFESEKVADYIRKPFESSDLLQKIRKILEAKGQPNGARTDSNSARI